MWKSFFLAAGIFACLLGAEMLLIDSAVVRSLDGSGGPQAVTAPEWAPWTLLSVGAVTILHFCKLPGGQVNGSMKQLKHMPAFHD